MKAVLVGAVAAVVLAGSALEAAGQGRGRYDTGYGRYPGLETYRNSYQAYSTRPGHQGIITWNTPNADGNLGGPGTGGSGGGGGK